MNYDTNKDYYAILGVSEDASRVDIQDRFSSLCGDTSLSQDQQMELVEAYQVLVNDNVRQSYDNDRANVANLGAVAPTDPTPQNDPNQNPGPQRVTGQQPAPARTTGNGRKFLKGLGITALILALMAGSAVVGWFVHDRNATKDLESEKSGYEQTVDTDRIDFLASADDEEKTEEVITVKDLGEISGDEFNQEVSNMLAYVNGIGAVNMGTGVQYSESEIKDLILYMNGCYVPKNEADAFTMEDNLLNFACVPLNDPNFINGIGLMSGNDTIGGDVVCKEVHFVDNMLQGNSYAYPYLSWLEGQYNKIITSSDVNVRVAAFNEAMQSFADIFYGDGYKMIVDGKEFVITSNDLTSKTRVNDGNMFRFLGLIMQPFRTEKTLESFTVNSSVGGTTQVSADEVLDEMNVKCAADIAAEAEYDTNGYLILPVNDNLDNTYDRQQKNSLSFAFTNYYLGNNDYGINNQRKTK